MEFIEIMSGPQFRFIVLMPGKGELSASEFSLFVSLPQEKKWAEAVKFYESILEQHQDYLPALNALAKVAYENRDYEASFLLLARIMKKYPSQPFCLNNMGVVLAVRNEVAKAEILFRQALTCNPDTAEIHYNWGCLLVGQQREKAALRVWRQGLERQKSHQPILFALGRLCKEQGLITEATAYCRQLTMLAPDEAEYRQNLGIMLLKQGELLEGFKLYEARWQANRLSALPPDKLWQGDFSLLRGKTILLWAEQGLGDTLQFVRYLPRVQAHAGQIVVAVPELLLGLMRSSFPLLEIVPLAELQKVKYQLQAPLLSLPRLLGSTLVNLPNRVPYIKVEEKFQARWRQDLGRSFAKLQVGFVWGGNPAHKNDARRSLPLFRWAPLFRMAGISWYSMQKGERESELVDFSAASGNCAGLKNLAPELDSFEDTAAAITALDLVISVDTSVAHLAGALAKPVWLLLPFDADWRWLLERNDTPWYPTMRLFRQPVPGDWESVITVVRNCLQEMIVDKSG